MEHSIIDDEHILDLYLMGRLDAPREEEFEAHLLGCERCNSELELRRRYIDGLRALDPGEFQISPPRIGDTTARWRAFALAASVLLTISTSVSVWSVREVSQLRSATAPSALASVPIVVMTLEQVRGSAGGASNVIESGGESRLYVLQIDADWQPGQRYEAALLPGTGEAVLRETLVPDHRGMLVLAVSSERLQPGEYTLEVRVAGGEAGLRQRFALRVVGDGGGGT